MKPAQQCANKCGCSRPKRRYTLEIFRGKPGKRRRIDVWYLRVKAPNGEVILVSEGRARPSGLRRTIARFIDGITSGRVQWATGGSV